MQELSYAEEQLEKLVDKVVLKAHHETFKTPPRKGKAKQPWYWNNTGLYQRAYDRLYNVLVPERDEAETTTGEVLRLLSKAYYRLYNDGDRIPDDVASLARAYVRGEELKWTKTLTW